MGRDADKLNRKIKELEQVDSAITAILSAGQSYGIGSRSLTRVSYDSLLKRKLQLEGEIASLSGGPGRFRKVIPIF